MKKHIIKIAVISGCLVCGCGFTGIAGSGKVVSEERKLAEFDRIQNASSADVTVHLGAEPRVVVQTDDNLMQYVETSVNGGTLEIKYKRSSMLGLNFTSIKIEVYTQTLVGAGIKGNGDMDIADEVRADAFKASLAGSGNLRGRVVCNGELNASISGSGDMKLAGSAAELNVELSGSGDFSCTDCNMQSIDVRIAGSGTISLQGKTGTLKANVHGSGGIKAHSLEAQTVAVNIAGSSDVNVWAVQTLDVNISGSGSVKYKGNPQLNQTIRGSGSVRGGV